jgi:hypothetical protein
LISQRLQTTQFGLNLSQLVVCDGVNIGTGSIRPFPQIDESPDVVQIKAELTRMTDEGEAIDRFRSMVPVVAACPSGKRKQPNARVGLSQPLIRSRQARFKFARE